MKLPWWAWAGGAAALFLSSGGVSVLTEAWDSAKSQAFLAALPARARPYGALILQVAAESGVSPLIIYALGEQESRWGAALAADGTGDFTPRSAATWGFAMPPDGGGWGRGLMQIDYTAAQKLDWRDPLTNIRAGVAILKTKMTELSSQVSLSSATAGGRVYLGDSAAARRGVVKGWYVDPRPLSGLALVSGAIAAYNTGALNVVMNLAAGKAAGFTTTKTNGANYDVSVASIVETIRSRMA